MFGNILWTIYLGILGTIAIGYLLKGKYKTFLAKVDFVVSIITWIGLFGYVTNTQILNPLVWKFVFFGGLLWDVIFGMFFNHHYDDESIDEIPPNVRFIIVAVSLVILVGPLYYGLFKYAF
ncbi:hypothetical protein [Neobacillus mesonae]|uniref:Uncharacterized protein n=1 Tax=Neobacillus mesonae TaxID=1193713 RepID=A0A3T0HSD2_9BACI|nr:hypothetical protein [Neobacillus mesonae]AZU60040.1 hypothetical protein CHR53_01410 [Neobacillus mesonae]